MPEFCISCGYGAVPAGRRHGHYIRKTERKYGIFLFCGQGEICKNTLDKRFAGRYNKNMNLVKSIDEESTCVSASAKRAGDGGSPAGAWTGKITSELQGEGHMPVVCAGFSAVIRKAYDGMQWWCKRSFAFVQCGRGLFLCPHPR